MRASTILVLLDGTIHSTAALPVAAALAEIEGAELHVMQLSTPDRPLRALTDSLGLTVENPGASLLHPAPNDAAGEAVRLADEWRSTYIVLCTHVGREKAHGALGRVAGQVLRTAPCPVVLVQPNHGQTPWGLHRILLPHDGTPATAAAVGPAADLARRAGAELLVLHVADLAAEGRVKPGTLRAPRYLDQPQHEWSAWGREFLERMYALGRRPAAVKLRLAVAAGAPGAEIVRFAREHEANLIVLAWSGRWEARRAATLKAVLRSSICPVLVVRAGQERSDR